MVGGQAVRKEYDLEPTLEKYVQMMKGVLEEHLNKTHKEDGYGIGAGTAYLEWCEERRKNGAPAGQPSEEDTKAWIRDFIARKKSGQKETFKEWADRFHKDQGVDVEKEIMGHTGEGQMLSYQGFKSYMLRHYFKEVDEEFWWSYREFAQRKLHALAIAAGIKAQTFDEFRTYWKMDNSDSAHEDYCAYLRRKMDKHMTDKFAEFGLQPGSGGDYIAFVLEQLSRGGSREEINRMTPDWVKEYQSSYKK